MAVQQRHRRSVRSVGRRVLNVRRPPSLRKLLPALLLALVISALAFLKVWQGITVYNLGRDLEGLRQEQARLLQQKEQLTLKIETLRRLERVEKVATDDLGLIYPPASEVVILASLGATPQDNPLSAAPLAAGEEPLEGGGE